jgi:uncharacterized protein (TIGR03435 family)
MLQALLVERFRLIARRESEETPVYALVAGKGGFKLKETEMGPGGTSISPGKLAATKMSMARFAEFLSGQVDRPVVNMTGIPGIYDFTLEWTQDAQAAPDAGLAADIYAAIAQLGLKLEKRQAPVEMLIIDHVQKLPVDN